MAIPALLSTVITSLRRSEWDVIGMGRTDAYNALVVQEGKDSVLTLLPPRHLVLCAGHSKRKWAEAKELLATGVSDPFDHMSEEAAGEMQQLLSDAGVSCDVFHAHSSEPFLVSFQRLAVATGVGVLHPDTHLILHRQFGPWIAFRFALVIGSISNDSTSRLSSHSMGPTSELDFVIEELKDILCDSRELILKDSDGGREASDIIQKSCHLPYSPSTFLAARQAFVIGSTHAYDKDQIAYHYHL